VIIREKLGLIGCSNFAAISIDTTAKVGPKGIGVFY